MADSGGSNPLAPAPEQSPRPGIEERLDQIDRRMKEQEPSFLRAVQTLLRDLGSRSRGEEIDLTPAILGAVFAYLRPRIVLVAGSIAAVVLAVIQIILVSNQNRLIDQQNQLVEQQTRATVAAAFSEILTRIEAGDTAMLPIRVTQLVEFGDPAVGSLIRLATFPGNVGEVARSALVERAPQHTYAQAVQSTVALLHAALASPRWNTEEATYYVPDSTVFVMADSGALQRFTRGMSALRAYVMQTLEAGTWDQRDLAYEAAQELPDAIAMMLFFLTKEMVGVARYEGMRSVSDDARLYEDYPQLPDDLREFADSTLQAAGYRASDVASLAYGFDVIASPLCYGVETLWREDPGLWVVYRQRWNQSRWIYDECIWDPPAPAFAD